jgi:Kef-type K+ transport system membrane component KefB
MEIMDDLTRGIDSLLAVAIVAAIAPFVAALLPGNRIPQVVVMLVGGVLIGPEVLGLADPSTIVLFTNVGLAFVFLLAGYEFDPAVIRERAGRLALAAWCTTAAIALLVVWFLATTGFVHAFVPVALGLTTTALGVLLPIMRDNGLLEVPIGRFVLAAGAVGEFLPILAIALFLGANSSFIAIISLVAMAGVAWLLVAVPRLVRSARLRQILTTGEHATSQTTLRWSLVLLLVLLSMAGRFGLDAVLGAFLAGVVLRRWAPGDREVFDAKLDAIGYGFFIPVFFVASGMGLDLGSIAAAPLRLVVFFVLLLAVRGLPALLVYRHALPARQRVQVVFFTATALPLLVALAEIGLRNGTMLPENAAALVGAGVLSVLCFPTTAVAIGGRQPVATAG